MKKQLFLFAACCTLAFTSQAQGVRFGPRAGVNLSTIKLDPKQEGYSTGNQIGFQAGMVVNIPVNEILSFQPEVLFSQKGFSSVVQSPFGNVSLEVAANYIELPTMIKASFGNGKIKPFLTGGPYAGFWLGGTSKTDFLGVKDTDKIDFKDDNNFNRLDMGLNAGAGVGFDVGSGQLTLDVRYGSSFVSFDEQPKDWHITNENEVYPTSKYRVIGVSLAYLFGGSK